MINSEFVVLHDDKWFNRQVKAGRCVAEVFEFCEKRIKSKERTCLKDFENIAIAIMERHNCLPTFKNYKGFPSAICCSVNNQLVHGVVTDYVLRDGDLITIDLGATYDGAIADAARTWIFGTPKNNHHLELVKSCRECLDAGVLAVKNGVRVGAIGNAINKIAKNTRFGLITKYGGHSISWNKPHHGIFVHNKSSPHDGVVITDGLTLAIEPMLTLGDTKTWVDEKDGWTVYTKDLNAHFENTLIVFNNKVHVVTE